MSDEEEEFAEAEAADSRNDVAASDLLQRENQSMIQAKVAEILTATDLALNRGYSDGVRPGMKFAIMNSRGREIKDPDTGKVRGSIELAKTLVKVVSVTDGLAVARTFRTRTGGAGLLGISSALVGTARSETLRSDEKRLQQELNPQDSYVKIGDVAAQYTGEFGGLVYEF